MSKKQILLEFFQARGKGPVEIGDLRAARDEIARRLGPARRTSLSYIASTLRAAGYDVRFEDRFSGPVIPEPYAVRLHGLLEFPHLARAELSLQRLDALFQEYRGAGDAAGMKWVRAVVRKGRLRARSLAANPRLQPAKRQEKQEIANWFQVWLETPELFADWLELRKSSEEFQSLFSGVRNQEE